MDIIRTPKPWYIRHRLRIAMLSLLTAITACTVFIALSPRQRNISAERIRIGEVREAPFMEYIEAEGIVYPVMTIQLNAMASGFVERILCEEGATLHKGDTIFVLNNPELLRTIAHERTEWEKTRRSLREQEIQMEQKSIELRLQALELAYKTENLERVLSQSREEFAMGLKSRAELNIAEAEYMHQSRMLRLQKEKQSHDSATTQIRREILDAERKAADQRYEDKRRETDGLVAVAPADGQLGHLNLTVGQAVGADTKVGELKIMDRYKVRTQLNEYYVERIHAGLPATVIQKQDTFRLRISRVVPEVKDRKFETDMLFCSAMPENIRPGKSYRVRIELSRPEQTVIIPRGDFYQKTGGQWIFRIDERTGVARRTEIEVGRMNTEQYEIVSGLKPGDRVIVNGYELLGDAEEVSID